MPTDSHNTNRRRRSRGDNAIYWDVSKNCYVGAISLGYTANGKRRRPKVYGKTETEVRDKLKDLRKELETGVKSDARYTVAQAVNDWLAKGLKGRSKATITKYRILTNTHIVPAIGKAKLKELTADDVDDWLESKRAMLATSTLKVLLEVLRRAITHAQRRDKVGRNVAALVTAPEGRIGRQSKALTMEQARAVLAAAEGWNLYAYIVVSLLTGIRTEEARALRWDHVILDGDKDAPPHVMVWRSTREHGDTKTRKSRRSLALPPLAVDELRAHRAKQDRDRQRAKQKWREHGLVFASLTGTPLGASNVRRAYKAIVEKAGLNPAEWTPRELRHSFVSIMSAHGVLVEDIARLVGHSSTATTETVYRKELRPVITKGAEVMGDLFVTTSSPKAKDS